MYSERLRKRRRRRIVLSALFSLLGIGTLGTATFAWFTTVRAVQLGYTGVQVMNTDDLRITYKFYGYDDDTRQGKELSFEGGNPDPFLEEYDSFIPDRNEHNNRIVKIDVETIREQTEARYLQLALSCTQGFREEKNGNNYVAPYISNIIYFRAAVATIGGKAAVENDDWYKALAAADNANDIYTSAVDFFNKKSLPVSTFVSNYENANSITDVKKNANLTISSKALGVSLPAGTKTATFYVEYNYSSTLIETYQKRSYFDDAAWGTTDILKGDSISFANDIPYMRVEYGEAVTA